MLRDGIIQLDHLNNLFSAYVTQILTLIDVFGETSIEKARFSEKSETVRISIMDARR